jgi:hypothetical protein
LAFSPPDATDFEGVKRLCRNMGVMSQGVGAKNRKKLGKGCFSAVSLHRQSDKKQK